ncbi:MAG: hypothetical protein K6T83_03610 [Alicyclobacillus sp.]|nr:hypothetical protein [Alicyclobacillus sp.]
MNELQKMAEKIDEIKLNQALASREGRPIEPVNFWDVFSDWFDIVGDHAVLNERGQQAVREMRAAEEAELDRNFREAMMGLMDEAMKVTAIVDPDKLAIGEITPEQGRQLTGVLLRMRAFSGFLKYTIELMQTEADV